MKIKNTGRLEQVEHIIITKKYFIRRKKPKVKTKLMEGC
jgi:hypothetical protein